MNFFTSARPTQRTVARIPIESICASPFQPRRTFPETSIAELAQSIRQHGMLSPLLVRRIGADRFELIAGERRLRALRLLGRSHAEAIVLSAFDGECALLALVENIQRENLHFLDEAEACRGILDGQNITQEQLAAALGVSPSALANRLRLLKLDSNVRAAVRTENLTERHARSLLRVSEPARQMELIRECANRRLSVKQLDDLIGRTCPPRKPSVSRVIRDNRIIINAVLDTVRELNRIGVQVESRVEERADSVEVIVRIPTLHTKA